MSCGTGARVLCEACGDWACATHEGHIAERCDCWPCDDCGDLFPPDELAGEAGLCRGCAKLEKMEVPKA